MSLFRVEVEKFKAFRERASLEYKPLTMFYGHNQAGKSTMLRLLPLLADSIYENNGALNMNSDSLASQHFRDLGHISGGAGIPAAPIMHLKNLQNETGLELQFGDEGGLIVNRLRLFNSSQRVIDVTWEKTKERRGELVTAQYQGTINGKDWVGDLKFDSLFPSLLPDNEEVLLKQLQYAFSPLKRIQWLRANRIRLDERPATSKSRCCAADGSDIAKKIPDTSRNQVLFNALDWLKSQDNLGNKLTVDSQQNFWIGANGRADLPLYLAGEGLRALLPILLSACWAEIKDEYGPTMLAIEEPEAHLHPHIQSALFDRLIVTINQDIPVAFETHSVYMLRAMQLAVLNKKIEPEDVALYWVEQQDGCAMLRKIDVQKDGTLHGWRPDIFEKEQELAQQIMEARWAMGSSN